LPCRLFADPRTRKFFDGKDYRVLMAHMTVFMGSALSGARRCSSWVDARVLWRAIRFQDGIGAVCMVWRDYRHKQPVVMILSSHVQWRCDSSCFGQLQPNSVHWSTPHSCAHILCADMTVCIYASGEGNAPLIVTVWILLVTVCKHDDHGCSCRLLCPHDSCSHTRVCLCLLL
jgi:hypothetical protein